MDLTGKGGCEGSRSHLRPAPGGRGCWNLLKAPTYTPSLRRMPAWGPESLPDSLGRWRPGDFALCPSSDPGPLLVPGISAERARILAHHGGGQSRASHKARACGLGRAAQECLGFRSSALPSSQPPSCGIIFPGAARVSRSQERFKNHRSGAQIFEEVG